MKLSMPKKRRPQCPAVEKTTGIRDVAIGSIFYKPTKAEKETYPPLTWAEKSKAIVEEQQSLWPTWFEAFTRRIFSGDGWQSRRSLSAAARHDDNFDFFVFQHFCSSVKGTDPYSALVGHVAALSKARSAYCRRAQQTLTTLLNCLYNAQDTATSALITFIDQYEHPQQTRTQIDELLERLEKAPELTIVGETKPRGWPKVAWTVLWLYQSKQDEFFRLGWESQVELLETAIWASSAKPTDPRPNKAESIRKDLSELRHEDPGRRWFSVLELAIKQRVWTNTVPFMIPKVAKSDLRQLQTTLSKRR